MSWKQTNRRKLPYALALGVLSASLLTGCSGISPQLDHLTAAVVGAFSDSELESLPERPDPGIIGSIFTPRSEMDDWVAEQPAEGLTGFYFQQLDEAKQYVYRQLYVGISDVKPEFYIDCDAVSDIEPALQALLNDHPEFFWLDGTVNIYGAKHGGKERITPAYNTTSDAIPGIQAQIDAAYQEYLATIPENATTYQVVRAAYQYLVSTTDYVIESPQNQNIQSVFLNRQSVCAGYAKAFQYLLNRIGVPCTYVHGEIASSGAAHAWNLVDIDGIKTWVDPTWGDPTYGENADDSARLDIIYDYLCMTDAELQRTGHVPSSGYTYPTVTDTTFDFYRLLGDYLTGYDESVVSDHLYETVARGENITYLKFDTFDAYAQAVAALFEHEGDLLNDPLQAKMRRDGTSSLQYYYSISDEMLTIKIFW